MRVSFILFFALSLITTACNLSNSASGSSILTPIPTITQPPQPTRTPMPTANTTTVTTSDTGTTNTGNNNVNNPAITETVICVKESAWLTYTVQAGDTLFGIAQRGNTTVDTLVKANCLVDAGLISVGQVLYVPSPVQLVPTPTPPPQLDPNRYTVELWWIIQGDNGVTGFPTGCGDSIYLQQSGIPANLSQAETLNRAINYLTDDNNKGTGQADRGWWNPMSTTGLVLDSYGVNGNQITAYLSGNIQLQGVCFDAQLEAQIALNLMSVTRTRSATIYINNQNMRQIFDASGTETRTSYTWDEFQYANPPSDGDLIEFWVASETNGVAGAISAGCDAYVAPITTDSYTSNNTVSDLQVALSALLDPNRVNPSTVYTNYLKDQNLSAFDISFANGQATVYIGSKLRGIGTCVDALIEAQIIQTIFQFEEIQTAKVYINGDTNLRQLVDQSGNPATADYVYTRS